MQELLLLTDVGDLLVERWLLLGHGRRVLHDLADDGAQAEVSDMAEVAALRKGERQGAVGLGDERIEVALVDEVHAAQVARLDERRIALAERDVGRGITDGQERTVAIHQPRAGVGSSVLLAELTEHVAHAHGAIVTVLAARLREWPS